MNTSNPINKDWGLNPISKSIIDHLTSRTQDELKKIYNINDSVLSQVAQYLEAFKIKTSFQAIDLYNGLSYRWLKNENLSQDDYRYLNDHLIILSALYGPIRPDTLIKAYRLDFNTKIKIENRSLKSIWKKVYNDSFNPEDPVINLASDEFSSLLDRDRLEIIDVEFFEEKENKLKKHSTISKKGRGQMTAFMAKNRLEEIDQIKEFDYDGYLFSKELSDDKKLVFIKKVE